MAIPTDMDITDTPTGGVIIWARERLKQNLLLLPNLRPESMAIPVTIDMDPIEDSLTQGM